MVGVKDQWVLLEESNNSKIFADCSSGDSEEELNRIYKVVNHKKYSSSSGNTHEPQCHHLQNEYDILEGLSHPNIVKVSHIKHHAECCMMS